jgi:broad specificity phosphatase PhoE
MSNLTLYLLRHGQSDANANHIFASRSIDPPLTDVGHQQIRSQARFLKPLGISELYCSPLLRARQTAEIVVQICGLVSKINESLIEVDVGTLDGRSIDIYDYRVVFSRVIEQWNLGHNDIGFPGGETLDDVKKRLLDFIKILDGEENKNILVVAHDITFMAFIWLFCDNHTPKFNDDNIRPGHISIVSKMDSKFHILRHNIAPEILGSK